MKPRERFRDLRTVCDLIANGQPLPPLFRHWIMLGFREKLSNPKTSLDISLGLASHCGGALNLGIPDRDAAICKFAHTLPGTTEAKVRELRRLLLAGDPSVTHLIECTPPAPKSIRQLRTILEAEAQPDQRPLAATTWFS